jgi:hypothetical protein
VTTTRQEPSKLQLDTMAEELREAFNGNSTQIEINKASRAKVDDLFGAGTPEAQAVAAALDATIARLTAENASSIRSQIVAAISDHLSPAAEPFDVWVRALNLGSGCVACEATSVVEELATMQATSLDPVQIKARELVAQVAALANVVTSLHDQIKGDEVVRGVYYSALKTAIQALSKPIIEGYAEGTGGAVMVALPGEKRTRNTSGNSGTRAGRKGYLAIADGERFLHEPPAVQRKVAAAMLANRQFNSGDQACFDLGLKVKDAEGRNRPNTAAKNLLASHGLAYVEAPTDMTQWRERLEQIVASQNGQSN